MAFSGWPAEALEFYEGLEADNSRAYWTDHRADYETQARAPMVALLADLEPEFGEGRIFRPYRDVRFSADKSPYKTAMGAMVGEYGYVQISANGLACGCGVYHMAPDQIERYRQAVDDERTGDALVRLVTTIRRQGMDVQGREVLRTAPRGYSKDHPRIQLLRNKGLVAWQEWPPDAWLGTAAAMDRVAGFLRASRPLSQWLTKHVGPSRAIRR